MLLYGASLANPNLLDEPRNISKQVGGGKYDSDILRYTMIALSPIYDENNIRGESRISSLYTRRSSTIERDASRRDIGGIYARRDRRR